MTNTTPAWTRIHALWPQFLTLKTSTAPPSDGMPRASSDPSHRAVLNLNILVLETETTDLVSRHAQLHRKRGGTATTLGQLIHENYPANAPIPERQAWEQFGSDILEEVESLLELRPRPWTQHKLDLLAEYPEQFQLTQTQTLIALAMLGKPMNDHTVLVKRIQRGTHALDENGRLNLADVLNQPVRTYERTNA